MPTKLAREVAGLTAAAPSWNIAWKASKDACKTEGGSRRTLGEETRRWTDLLLKSPTHRLRVGRWLRQNVGTQHLWWVAIQLGFVVGDESPAEEASAALAAVVGSGLHLPPAEPLLDGYEIQRICDVSMGPEIGAIGRALSDKQLADPTFSKDDAIEWARQGALGARMGYPNHFQAEAR